MIKLTKTPILPNCQIQFFFFICKFYHSKIEKQTFVSVSLVRGKSERIEKKFKRESSGLWRFNYKSL